MKEVAVSEKFLEGRCNLAIRFLAPLVKYEWIYCAEEVRKTVIGLSRDLRGIAFAFNTKVSYMMLFDWIYPQYTPILQRAVEIWLNDPQVHYFGN